MNPFAQLDVHDDEEDFVQPTAAQKPPKKSIIFYLFSSSITKIS